MYHFVNSSKDSSLFSGMQGVTVENFESQLSTLINKGHALVAKDIKLAAFTGCYPNNDYFHLTFDDGFKQHFNNVYPILKDYGIQASFFIPTMAIEIGKIPVVEKQRLLQYNLFSDYKDFLTEFCILARKVCNSENQNFLYPVTENIKRSKNYLKQFTFYSEEERYFRMIRNEFLSVDRFTWVIENMFKLFFENDFSFINEYYLSASDLKKMGDNGMIIGGHTHSHPFLNKLSIDEIKKEVDQNIAFLEKTINKNIKSFAYPFGAFNNDVINCMSESSIDYAFDTRTHGMNTQYNVRRNDAATYFD